jgi:hypothetical protein
MHSFELILYYFRPNCLCYVVTTIASRQGSRSLVEANALQLHSRLGCLIVAKMTFIELLTYRHVSRICLSAGLIANAATADSWTKKAIASVF